MVATPTRVDLYFDPACPFAWITSRWLLEVGRYRHLAVRLRPMSLYLLNTDREVDAGYRALLNRSPGAARVLVAAAQRYGDGALADLYTALGTAMFTRSNHEVVHNPRRLAEPWGRALRAALDTALGEVGLAAELAEAADSTGYDQVLRDNQYAAIGKVGEDVGTPIMHIDGTGIFGPVLTAIPRGLTAALVFDAVRLLACRRDFFELKRGLAGEFSFA